MEIIKLQKIMALKIFILWAGAAFLLASPLISPEANSWEIYDLMSNLASLSKDLKFLTPSSENKQFILIQPANTSVGFYEKLPGHLYFQGKIKTSGPTSAFLKFSSQGGKELLSIKIKKGLNRKKIELPEDGLYEISLVTKGRYWGRVFWQELYFFHPEKIKPTNVSPYKPNSLSPNNRFGARNPDIFLYIIDALRPDHLGCYGYFRSTSPSIDALASESAVYVNAYACSSWTRTSAASILTGLRPKDHKTLERDDVLATSLTTLPEKLKEFGYETIGVVANGNIHRVFGFDQGFDLFRYLGGLAKSSQVHREVASILAARGKKAERKPLFLLLWTIDPHDPYEKNQANPDEFCLNYFQPIPPYPGNLLVNIRSGMVKLSPSQKEYLKALYDQEIRANDRSFGQFIHLLKSAGLYRSSIIFLTSDHGEEIFDHGSVGHGTSLYSEQIRVPFILKAPFINHGLHQERIQHIDIFPTILSILDKEKPDYLPGQSLLTLEPEERPLLFELSLDGNNQTAIIDGPIKIIYYEKKAGDKDFQPYSELFRDKDPAELLPLRISTLEEKFAFQRLLLYKNISEYYPQKESQIKKIPAEVERQLRTLGYIK